MEGRHSFIKAANKKSHGWQKNKQIVTNPSLEAQQWRARIVKLKKIKKPCLTILTTKSKRQFVYQNTVDEIERVTSIAIDFAKKRRNKITLVDKANVLETSRLWRKTVQEISLKHPELELDYMFVDNAAMQIILNPKQFDVILTENLFGDIISDEASVIGGSIGILSSASIGESMGLFEPIHGSFPQATNKNIANPVAAILSASMMLNYLNLGNGAKMIEEAVENSLINKVSTADINNISPSKTSQVGDYISNFIKENN